MILFSVRLTLSPTSDLQYGCLKSSFPPDFFSRTFFSSFYLSRNFFPFGFIFSSCPKTKGLFLRDTIVTLRYFSSFFSRDECFRPGIGSLFFFLVVSSTQVAMESAVESKDPGRLAFFSLFHELRLFLISRWSAPPSSPSN